MQQLQVTFHVPFTSDSTYDLLRVAYEKLQNNGVNSDFQATAHNNRENIYQTGSIQPISIVNTRGYTEVICNLYVVQKLFGYDISRPIKSELYSILLENIIFPIFGERSHIVSLNVVGVDFAMGERDLSCWFDDRTFTYNVSDDRGHITRHRTHEEAMQALSDLHWYTDTDNDGLDDFDSFLNDCGNSQHQAKERSKEELVKILDGLKGNYSSYNDNEIQDVQEANSNRTIKRKTGRNRTIFIVKEE